MIRSNFCDGSDAYMHVKVIITVPNTGTAAASNNTNKNKNLGWNKLWITRNV